MTIDISYEKEFSVQEMIEKTINFCGLDYESKTNRYICTGSMLFSIVPGFIHISSILETEFEIQFLQNYIKCLFEDTVIGISCVGFIDDFKNISNVRVIDITTKLC